jgi:hypothetical protein
MGWLFDSDKPRELFESQVRQKHRRQCSQCADGEDAKDQPLQVNVAAHSKFEPIAALVALIATRCRNSNRCCSLTSCQIGLVMSVSVSPARKVSLTWNASLTKSRWRPALDGLSIEGAEEPDERKVHRHLGSARQCVRTTGHGLVTEETAADQCLRMSSR